VDGVLSLFGYEDGTPPPGDFHWVNGVLHCIGEGAGERLLRLGDRFELVWATGWEETANEFLPHLLGLPGGLPCLTFGAAAVFGTAHWKLDAIAHYAGNRPAAWIDDCHDESCWRWAERRDAPTLLVTTHSAEGIRDDHVEHLLAWADKLNGGRRPAAPAVD